MKAYILTVGDEILIGQVTDTNATYLAQGLTQTGLDVVEHLSVADSAAGIRAGLDRALTDARVVLMTGGLGPTKDDITKVVLAEYFGTELVFHEETWERLQRLIRKFGREPNEQHKAQCFLPAAATILTNKVGTAPGMWLETADGRMVVSMPGVPYEMRYLTDNEVLPRLAERLDDQRLIHRTLMTAGEGESWLNERIADLEAALPAHVSLSFLPNLGTVRLRLTARGRNTPELREELATLAGGLEERLTRQFVYGYDEESLEEHVGKLLLERGLQLGTAESCTGGNIGRLITSVPGSSAYYRGGVVAYSNELKHILLDVPEATIEAEGAVSEATARAMVAGACRRLGVDVALAVTGIAGPGGGTEEKPVGTIWIAVGTADEQRVRLLRAGKRREQNVQYASLQALNLLRLWI
ncbi:MAG: competence/damage-inducible protein A [Saprospiraceae bacterium]